MKYLVTTLGDPGFSSLKEASRLLEKIILPSFDVLMPLAAEENILAGGIPNDQPLHRLENRCR